MKTTARWMALPAMGAVAFLLTAWAVYWPLHIGASFTCPSWVMTATTDLSSPDYSSRSARCMAPWYRFVEGGVFGTAVLAAALAGAVMAHTVAPTRKRPAAAAFFVASICVVVAQFVFNR